MELVESRVSKFFHLTFLSLSKKNSWLLRDFSMRILERLKCFINSQRCVQGVIMRNWEIILFQRELKLRKITATLSNRRSILSENIFSFLFNIIKNLG